MDENVLEDIYQEKLEERLIEYLSTKYKFCKYKSEFVFIGNILLKKA